MKKIQQVIFMMMLVVSGLYAEGVVQKLTVSNFQETIEKNDLVLVSFTAPWCGSCKKMKPKYANVAEKFKSKVIFAEVNTDEEKSLANAYRITNVPTTLLFKNGKEQSYYVGALEEEEIELFVNPTEIINKYTLACENKDGLSCRKLALFYDDGVGLKVDKTSAIKFYEKGCQHSDIKSCFNVGYMYDLAEGVQEDNHKAVEHYSKACEGDHRVACHNLALMYEEGEGTKEDSAMAITLYDKACQLSYGDACYNLALIYQKGKVVPKDLDKAKALYMLSCNEGDDEACEEVKKLND
jgi:thioredoxin